MTHPVSGCMFIRSCFKGAFCAFESMASMLPFVDEFIVLDLGSDSPEVGGKDDGTLHYLGQIAAANPKVRLEHGVFPEIDAGAFATLANDLVGMCSNEAVWYCQADEIPHQGLLKLVDGAFARGEFDWTFWRIQYHNNFQFIKWFPQPVNRVGTKDRFNFVGDGMGTDRTFDAPFLSDCDGGWFHRWDGELGQEGVKPYVDQMLLDVSLIGGFRDNVPERRALHAPFWREALDIPYKDAGQVGETWMSPEAWMAKAKTDPDWTKTESPYDLPEIMKWHVGRTRYELRRDLFEALCEDDTRGLLGLD